MKRLTAKCIVEISNNGKDKYLRIRLFPPIQLTFILGLLFDWRGIDETTVDKRYASFSNDTLDAICNNKMLTSVLVAKKLRQETI